jgi:hypothetical protein
MRGKDERLAYQGLVWQCRYSDIEVPDDLWKCTVFGAGKPFADDQAEDMVAETGGMNAFDEWVRAFVSHVETKGPVPVIKEAERSAATTTNQDRAKAG